MSAPCECRICRVIADVRADAFPVNRWREFLAEQIHDVTRRPGDPSWCDLPMRVRERLRAVAESWIRRFEEEA